MLGPKLKQLTISITFKYPYENTIVFGGVATGNMNANEVDIADGSMIYIGCTWIPTA